MSESVPVPVPVPVPESVSESASESESVGQDRVASESAGEAQTGERNSLQSQLPSAGEATSGERNSLQSQLPSAGEATSGERNSLQSQSPSAPLVLVVMGVSGSGKSTVAEKVAGELGWDFAEGDSMHPESNVAKMAAGTPLTDDDRWPWLDVVAAWIREHADADSPGVITCSALKHSYRDVLRGPGVVFVHLEGSPELLSERIHQRTGHFMPSTLLDSQLATFEPLSADERHVEIDAGRSPDEEAAEIIERLGLRQA